jgi:predicted acyltransferase
MGLIGIGCLLAGYAMSPLVPVIMKLWTSSYGILSAGWSCLLFLLFFWIIDARSHRKWAFPFVVIGMNALAIYIGVSVVPVRKIVGIFSSPIGAHLGALGPLFSAFAVVAVEWMVLYWMYNRKIFIRA